MKELKVTEEVYNKAIYIVAILSAVTSGLIIEIRERNPWKIYRKPERNNGDTFYNIIITIISVGVIAIIDYFLAKVLL